MISIPHPIQALGANILAKVIEDPFVEKSKLILPDKVSDGFRGDIDYIEVLSVGTSKDIEVGVGDICMIRPRGGVGFNVGNDIHIFVPATGILGVIDISEVSE